MLKILRKKGLAKKVIWVIAIVIIFSFGFFGTAYLITGNARTSYAGKIYGKKITVEDFNRVYQNARIQAVRQYGTNLSKVAHLLNLEARTWDLILLLHEAKKRRIKVSDKDIVRSIESDESFQKNGRFDILLYNTILRSLQIRPRDYEETVRDNLEIAELYDQITSSVTITEEEVLDEFRKRNEKVQVSYATVQSDAFLDQVNPDDSQILDYFNANTSEFEIPPSVNVRYLTFDFPKTERPEDESGEETADDAANDMLEKQKDVIRDKAENVFNELLVDPDMGKIAKSHNLDMKTSGFFSMDQPNLSLGWSYDLLNRIFQMNVGDVSDPVETSNGLTIVQIKEKRDAYIPEFGEVKDKVRSAVAKKLAKDVARQKATELLETIKTKLGEAKIKDFAATAKELNLEIVQTPVFTRGQYLPQIGISKEFQEAAFALTEENKLSEIVEIANGYCILYLDNYVPIDEKEFEPAKDELAKSISKEKRDTVFGDFMAQLRVNAGLVDNIPELNARAAQ